MLGGYTIEGASNKRGHDSLGYQEDGSQKRVRTLQPPSKVIHVRNLPQDCQESDLLAIASPFGKVVNILHLRGANQAFIQMADQIAATSLVEYHATTPAFLRSNIIYFQYSSRNEISAPTSHEPANFILLITVSNMAYPITIDVLQSVFSRYGHVLKIVIFSSKNGSFQSLIQFSDVTSAATAKTSLDGQNIYVGCCTLKIQYSTMSALEVKFNNDKSRDFTNPNLPASNTPAGSSSSAMRPLTSLTQMSLVEPTINNMSGMSSMPGMSGMSSMPGMTSMSNYMPAAYGQQNQVQSVQPTQYGVQQGFAGGATGGGNSVVIVSGLNQERVNPDVLFTLFGVYGDVQVVKILFNKKDTALVQMAAPAQAEFVIAHLNGVNLYNSTLHINMSKHASINKNANSEGEAASYTKDFTNSPLHRYKKAGSKNFMHICPPGPTLHLSNIPPSATEDSLKILFSRYGHVVALKFFATDRKMALVQMGNTAEAIEALIGVHNSSIDETAPNHVRVSFAKAVIREGDNKQ